MYLCVLGINRLSPNRIRYYTLLPKRFLINWILVPMDPIDPLRHRFSSHDSGYRYRRASQPSIALQLHRTRICLVDSSHHNRGSRLTVRYALWNLSTLLIRVTAIQDTPYALFALFALRGPTDSDSCSRYCCRYCNSFGNLPSVNFRGGLRLSSISISESVL